MKKIYSLIILLIISLSMGFAQDGYRGQRKTVDNVDCKVTNVSYSSGAQAIDIYFSSAVDPRSVNVSIDSSVTVGKITFNRDGTQARVEVSKAPPFTVKITGVKSYDGKAVPAFTKKL